MRIIGRGDIGDKAEQLKNKQAAIEKAGFVTNPRTVFAMDFFKRSRGRFLFDQRSIEAVKSDCPLAVRSSAYGDCRGTGIYWSSFSYAESIQPKISEVLESGEREDAREFRRKMRLKKGIAVIVEPVFGSWHEPNKYDLLPYFGPIYSGIAHTCNEKGIATSLINGGLAINAAEGIGLPADEKSRSIERAALEMDDIQFMSWREATASIISADTGFFIDDSGGVSISSVPKNPLRKKDMSWLFDRLKRLQDLLKKPQYVEWAAKANGEVAITQIADMGEQSDFYELTDNEQVAVRSRYVSGSGRMNCRIVAEIFENTDDEEVRRFNRENRDFVLIYPGKLTSFRSRLPFDMISNASVLVERFFEHHMKRPESHFRGLLNVTRKLFLIARRSDVDLSKFGRPDENAYPGMKIFRAKTTTTTNSKLQKGIVELV